MATSVFAGITLAQIGARHPRLIAFTVFLHTARSLAIAAL
jgi:hypothetical protein